MKDYATKNRRKMFIRKSDTPLVITATIIAVILTIVLFKAIENQVDMWALRTCEQHNDCTEVIRSINNK